MNCQECQEFMNRQNFQKGQCPNGEWPFLILPNWNITHNDKCQSSNSK